MVESKIKVPVIALATRNNGKIEEIKIGLADTAITVRTVNDFPGFPEVDETETSLQGNAALKSEALFKFSGIPSLADDTGLEVEALDGAPGLMSARYAGEDCNPAENRILLLENLAGVDNRHAQFKTVLAFTDQTGTRYFEGLCRGTILSEERGIGGFGYDPIFLPECSALSFAQLSSEAKNAMSHRGHALRLFFDFIRTYPGDK